MPLTQDKISFRRMMPLNPVFKEEKVKRVKKSLPQELVQGYEIQANRSPLIFCDYIIRTAMMLIHAELQNENPRTENIELEKQLEEGLEDDKELFELNNYFKAFKGKLGITEDQEMRIKQSFIKYRRFIDFEEIFEFHI